MNFWLFAIYFTHIPCLPKKDKKKILNNKKKIKNEQVMSNFPAKGSTLVK